jgi:ribosomal protein S24E
MIMNRTRIKIKNDTITMINNLANRKELQVKLRYMRKKTTHETGECVVS